MTWPSKCENIQSKLEYGQTRDEQGCEEGEEVSGKGTL